MKVGTKWRALGWRHPLWDYIRFYSVVGRQKKAVREAWVKRLQAKNELEIDATHFLSIPPADVKLFFDYLKERAASFDRADALLRTEVEALAYCAKLGAVVAQVKTKSADHHQSSAAMVATVGAIALGKCQPLRLDVIIKPDRRCAWVDNDILHVTARNIDGAIPSLLHPAVIWEIKEYWGKTQGGSKMSDAVYECNLVGRELREFEERAKTRVNHVVFLDGKEQWGHRQSDLRRFIDLLHQGIIDQLIVGREVETQWGSLLDQILKPLAKANK
jgi:hypothetical protein